MGVHGRIFAALGDAIFEAFGRSLEAAGFDLDRGGVLLQVLAFVALLAEAVEHLEDLHAAVAIADERVAIADALVADGYLVGLVALLALIFFADH